MIKTIPQGISIIYFNQPQNNIYAKLPVDKEQAKKMAKRVYKDAMTAIARDKENCRLLCQTLAE